MRLEALGLAEYNFPQISHGDYLPPSTGLQLQHYRHNLHKPLRYLYTTAGSGGSHMINSQRTPPN